MDPDDKRPTLSELEAAVIAHYRLSGKCDASIVGKMYRALKLFFGSDCDVSTLGYDRLCAYAAYRLEMGRKPATAHNELKYLRIGMREMARAGRLQLPQFPRLKIQNARQGFFEDTELDAIVSRLPEDLRPFIRFLSYTGWRKGEAIKLNWGNVDFRQGLVRLEPGTTKNGDGRTFPFRELPALNALMEEQRRRTQVMENHYGQIIPSVFWRRWGPRIRAVRRFETSWRKACLDACYPGKLIHDLRRTAVRRLERAGVSRSVAMRLTGHKTERIYNAYAIVNERDLSEGVKKLNQIFPIERDPARPGSSS